MSIFDSMSAKQKAIFLLLLFACGVIDGYFMSNAAFEKERYERIDKEIHAVQNTSNFTQCEMFLLNQSIRSNYENPD